MDWCQDKAVRGSANLFLLASAPPGENELADQLVKGIKKDILTCLQLLQRVDRVPVVFWTIPDVTLTPYALSLGLTSEQASNVRLHLHELNHFIRARGSRSQYTVLDAKEILTSLTFDPPVIFGMPILPTPVFGILNSQFADPIHPTAVVNAIVANEVIVLLNGSFNDSIPLYTEAELADLAGF